VVVQKRDPLQETRQKTDRREYSTVSLSGKDVLSKVSRSLRKGGYIHSRKKKEGRCVDLWGGGEKDSPTCPESEADWGLAHLLEGRSEGMKSGKGRGRGRKQRGLFFIDRRGGGVEPFFPEPARKKRR